MSRFACLVVPDLPVAALCRVDAGLVGHPLVLTEGRGPQARVTAASVAARARGVVPGRMTAAQARMLATDLVLQPRNATAERAATLALADVAGSLASRIEIADDGAVYLEATGAAHLAAGEPGLATALVTRAARVGLTARVGIGATMTVARMAARHGDGTTVVPAGAELGFLAPLPVASLAPPLDVAATFVRWGVHRLGDLARLPAAEVATRLGARGAALVRQARGEDDRPLVPRPPDVTIEETVDLDESPLDTLEPLLFVLRGLVERTVARLGLQGVGCTTVALLLGLADGSRTTRTLPLAAPTRDVRTLVTCLRAVFESQPPQAAISRVTLGLTPAAVRPTQLGLFTPPGPAPERLAATLVRLGALCGAERIGAPVVVDAHCPGRAGLAPFSPETPGAVPTAGGACRLAVRVLRPPQPLEVFLDRGEPTFVRGPGLGGRVIGAAGPWRITAEWWTDEPVARDYYDFELSDGGLYRCFHAPANGWFVDGVYD